MRNFRTVFEFEFFQQIKKRVVIISTIILAIVAFGGAAAPAILNQFKKQAEFESSEGASYLNEYVPGGYYVPNEEIVKELRIEESSLYPTEDALKEAVKSGKETKGYAIYDYDHYKTYFHDKGFVSGMDQALNSVLRDHLIAQKFSEKGISYNEYQSMNNVEINAEEEVLGRDTSTQYLLAFIYIITLYSVILMFGSIVATAVAREKDSRTMELLITTTNPKNLIIGKVLAITCASVIQMLVIASSAVISYFIFRNMYPMDILMMTKKMLDLSMLGMYVFYFILGLLLYMFIFAALGSVVSRMEDVNSAISPVMFLFITSYMIAMSALQGGDSIILKISSWIPFFSVMVMPIRNAITTVAVYEVIGSTLLTVVFIYLFARLSIRIYRWGTLNYGNKPNFFKVCKEVLFTKE
ncbi:ABC transporter permease [uncultured Solobacterium sp.]|uniref:ABC transporter permease n=1 Tax=uncultured Solobacterium sp. TaxID=747375 RepID=UPI0028EC25CB|nr:ABC transporter permease [uncultured Solobacterium sp.]